MNKKEHREVRQAKKKRQNLISTLLWSGVAIVVVGLFGYIISGVSCPGLGKEILLMEND